MPTVNIDLPENIEERFENLAQRRGAAKDFLILSALEEWLEDQEDIAMAEEVIAGIKAGAMEVYPAEEVWERLGLED